MSKLIEWNLIMRNDTSWVPTADPEEVKIMLTNCLLMLILSGMSFILTLFPPNQNKEYTPPNADNGETRKIPFRSVCNRMTSQLVSGVKKGSTQFLRAVRAALFAPARLIVSTNDYRCVGVHFYKILTPILVTFLTLAVPILGLCAIRLDSQNMLKTFCVSILAGFVASSITLLLFIVMGMVVILRQNVREKHAKIFQAENICAILSVAIAFGIPACLQAVCIGYGWKYAFTQKIENY